jgi:triacylglycerol lipase
MTILAAVAILGVFLVIGGLRVLRKQDPGTRPDQARPGPVILVPGYGGSQSALLRLAGRLAATGRSTQVLTLPDGGTGDLLTQADTLDTAVRTALRNGAPSVDVVGYSAGGVVARLWVRDFGGQPLARRVVTLGSPHRGTGLASLAGSLLPDACPVACRQLAPDSDLLRRLNSGDETPAGPQWVSVWSTVDEVVRPPDSARLEGALDLTVQDVCPRSQVQHGDLPDDPVVQGIVLAELAATPTVALSAADCRRLSS